MAKKSEETAEPAPIGIRTALRELVPHASHSAAAAALGHDPAHLIVQADMHLNDAEQVLRQLASLAGGVGAERIHALIERLT